MTKGDRIRKRGLGHLGTVKDAGRDGWISVTWDDGPMPRERPKICLDKELELA